MLELIYNYELYKFSHFLKQNFSQSCWQVTKLTVTNYIKFYIVILCDGASKYRNDQKTCRRLKITRVNYNWCGLGIRIELKIIGGARTNAGGVACLKQFSVLVTLCNVSFLSSCKTTIEAIHGLMSQVIKDKLFNQINIS